MKEDPPRQVEVNRAVTSWSLSGEMVSALALKSIDGFDFCSRRNISHTHYTYDTCFLKYYSVHFTTPVFFTLYFPLQLATG